MRRHVDHFAIYELNAHKKVHLDSDCIAEYDMKFMDIDSDEYEPGVTRVSSEFTRIIRDLSQLGGECPYRGQQGRRLVFQ